MAPSHYFSIGPFHIILRWGHDWVPNGMNGMNEDFANVANGYTCWRCFKRKVGKAYPVQNFTLERGPGDTLVGHVRIGYA